MELNVLSQMRGLVGLDLSCNRIGNDGGRKIAEMSELMSLNFSDNEITYRSYFEVKRMSELTVLSFTNNVLDSFDNMMLVLMNAMK